MLEIKADFEHLVGNLECFSVAGEIDGLELDKKILLNGRTVMLRKVQKFQRNIKSKEYDIDNAQKPFTPEMKTFTGLLIERVK